MRSSKQLIFIHILFIGIVSLFLENKSIDFMRVFVLKNNESYVTYDPVADTYLNIPSLTDLKIWDFHHDPKVLDPEIPEIKCVELSDVEVNQLNNIFGAII